MNAEATPFILTCKNVKITFHFIDMTWVPREQNMEANDLAQMASGYPQISEEVDIAINYLEPGDWRADIYNYLKDLAHGASQNIRYKALKYILIGDELYYRILEGMNLRCLGPTEAEKLMYEVHEGIYGTHQSAHKMKWLIRCIGYFWPTFIARLFQILLRNQGRFAPFV
jgi:hypothetical protein